MSLECESQSARQTKKIGELLAKEILGETKAKKAKVLALKGELGGGKTTFLQGFARGIGIKEKILSPTFIIQKSFKIKKSNFKFFYHIDCYRIQKQKEILDLDFKNTINNPQNIVAVEWADRIAKILPKNIIKINFKVIDKNKREIILE
jgi:tRNA threonylcarbamoyladenosine biosynthesis protein TsaE